MKLITSRSKILKVADVWWRSNEIYSKGKGRDRIGKIRERLGALDKDKATAADVDEIIGNKFWARPECDECGEYVEAVVELGEESDYESRTAAICKACFEKALGFLS